MSACCATGQNSQQLFEVVWSGQDVRSMRVIHLLTTQSIIMDTNNHEFMHSSFIVHSRRIMSCHVQLPRISQQSICTMQQQTLCSMPTISSTQPWTIFCRQGRSGEHAALAQEDRILVSVHRPPRPLASPDACCWRQDCSKPG